MDRRLGIVVVSYNTRDKTARCLSSLLRNTDLQSRVVIVDNASTDGSADMLRRICERSGGRVALETMPQNVGYAPAALIGSRQIEPGWDVVYVNSDLVVPKRWATRLARHFDWDDRIGAVAPLGSGIGGWQDCALRFGELPRGRTAYEVMDRINASLLLSKVKAETVKSLQGTLLWVDARAHEEVGGLDPMCELGADDADYSLRLRIEGWKLVVALDTCVWHDGHSSFAQLRDGGNDWINRSWDYFNQKWSGRLGDASWSALFEDREPSGWPPYVHRIYAR